MGPHGPAAFGVLVCSARQGCRAAHPTATRCAVCCAVCPGQDTCGAEQLAEQMPLSSTPGVPGSQAHVPEQGLGGKCVGCRVWGVHCCGFGLHSVCMHATGDLQPHFPLAPSELNHILLVVHVALCACADPLVVLFGDFDRTHCVHDGGTSPSGLPCIHVAAPPFLTPLAEGSPAPGPLLSARDVSLGFAKELLERSKQMALRRLQSAAGGYATGQGNIWGWASGMLAHI